ncbi:MAG: extracellular solute-binding protein [Oscillospiraceae bacterium]|nr:extracellular solute-binding protein [Oscillospiraceae bacterium]MCL2279772.1 extracellular solute-binding protein [Oscillospiraceae bacterium]
MLNLKNNWKMKIISLFILAAVGVMMLVGCGDNNGQSDDPLSGTITVYTAIENVLAGRLVETFEERYPNITVNLVRDSTGVITSRLIAEANNPQADVVWGTAASSLMVLEDMGMLEPFAPTGLERILPLFRSDLNPPTWVGITAWETAFIINIPELEALGLSVDDIRCYEDLLRPELQGNIIMPNPASSGTGFLTVVGLLELYGRDGGGWDFMENLHLNIQDYIHSGAGPANMAAAGETVIGISFGFPGISRLQEGAPVAVVFPEAGSGWDMEANALIRKDDIHPAARTFLNWAISDEAMAIYNEAFPIIATGEGGSYYGFENQNPVDQLIGKDFVWIATNRESILAEWERRFGG